ncbi:restriction endonuclease subunit S [Lactococcus lactis]|uniref:restriction endonuclease subunit S n=1 Tax=Lactococcus lactis TaxID=1358 RepID=UPI00288DE47C|nr:restriction endonuclease subunit S [Lactococcus lactis]MDT2895921.1 restriction endonuclease subunit S [Lactococcus lactis]
MNQLKNKYSIDWREFEIQSLFEKVPTKKLPYKAQDLKNIHDKIYCLPALTAGTLNQGLAYYVPREGATILKNVISVSANGANTGVMYYQPREFTVLQDSYAIKYIYDEPKPKHYIYLVSALQKSIAGRFNWSNKAGWERIKTELIKLPVKSYGEIAFDYIEEFVNTLEAERLATLEAYLQATGLKDVELNEAEAESLQRLGKTGGGEWKEFPIVELFTVKNTHNILSRDISKNSGKIPYLTASRENNSVGTYISYDESQIEEGNSIFIGGKTFVVTYQKNDYFSNDSHNLALYLKDYKQRTSENQLFFATSIYKSLAHRYSWGNSISNKKIQTDNIKLLVNSKGIPDYNLMNNIICATKKIVIKNVVEWLDKRIQATKQVILK